MSKQIRDTTGGMVRLDNYQLPGWMIRRLKEYGEAYGRTDQEVLEAMMEVAFDRMER